MVSVWAQREEGHAAVTLGIMVPRMLEEKEGRGVKRLFLDCDGVLADFDSAALQLLGMPAPEYEALHGTPALYAALHRAPDFYFNLKPMPQAYALMASVQVYNPTILTGTPRGDWAKPQKLRWRDVWFPGTPMFVCKSTEKRKYCQPGDVLLDDRRKYAHLWRAAGGTFILYDPAVPLKDTLREVREAMK